MNFSIVQNVKDLTVKFKVLYDSIKKPSSMSDISPAADLQANVLYNLDSVSQSVESIRAALRNSSINIDTVSKDIFASAGLFSDFRSELNKIVLTTRETLTEFKEAANVSGLLNSLKVEEAGILAENITQKALVQQYLLERFANILAQGGDLDASDLAEFSNLQESLRREAKRLQEIRQDAKTEIRVAQRVAQGLENGSEAIAKEVLAAVEGFKGAYRSVLSGNLKEAKSLLKEMHTHIETASRIKTTLIRTQSGDKPSLLARTMLGFAKALNGLVQGLQSLVKPISIFVSAGVFGLVSLVYKIFSAVNEFNRNMIERRGARQFQTEINFALDKNLANVQLEKKRKDFADVMRDTSFTAGQNTTNVYNITKEQFDELDSLVSKIHLGRIMDEADNAINSTQAQMALINEVLTFSKSLGISLPDSASIIDSFVSDQQYKLDAAGQALAYLGTVAAEGNINSYMLFNMFRSTQGRMSGLNTRVAGIINLIALLQKTKILSQKEQEGFISQVKEFSTNLEQIFTDISHNLVSVDDVRDIYGYYESMGIVGNPEADASFRNQFRTTIEQLSSSEGFEKGVLNLRSILETDPSLQFIYAIAAIRKRLLSNIDIFTASSGEIINFISENQRTLEGTLGVQFGKFGADALLVLARLKKGNGEKINNLRDIIKAHQLNAVKKDATSAGAVAKAASQDFKSRLFRQRSQFTSMFNTAKNYLELLFIDLSSQFQTMADTVLSVFSLGLFSGVRVTQLFREATSLNAKIQKLLNQYKAQSGGKEIRNEIVASYRELDAKERELINLIKESGDKQTLKSIESLLSSRRVRVSNAIMRPEEMEGLDTELILKYHTDFARERQDKIEQAIRLASQKTKRKDLLALAEANYEKFLLKNKISKQDYVLLFLSLLGQGNLSVDRAASAMLEVLSLQAEAPSTSRRLLGTVLPFTAPDLSSNVVFEKAKINPNLFYPISQILSSTAEFSVEREMLLKGFFRAAAQVPEALDLLGRTNTNLSIGQLSTLESFRGVFNEAVLKEAPKDRYFSQGAIDTISRKAAQIRLLSAMKPQKLSLTIPKVEPTPFPIPTEKPKEERPSTLVSLFTRGYNSFLDALYPKPEPKADESHWFNFINSPDLDKQVKDSLIAIGVDYSRYKFPSSQRSFLLADVEVDSVTYFGVNPNDGSYLEILPANTDLFNKTVESSASKRINAFAVKFITQ